MPKYSIQYNSNAQRPKIRIMDSQEIYALKCSSCAEVGLTRNLPQYISYNTILGPLSTLLSAYSKPVTPNIVRPSILKIDAEHN